jgi:hypothetical protein
LFLLALEREKNEKIQRIIFKTLQDCCLLFELPANDQITKAMCDKIIKNGNTYPPKTRKLLTLGFCRLYAFGKYGEPVILGQLMLKCSSDLFEPEKSVRDLIWRFFNR